MDTKRLIIGMSLAMGVMLSWQLFINYLDRKNPEWGLIKRPQVDQVTTQPATAPVGVVPPVMPLGATTQAATVPAGPTNIMTTVAPQLMPGGVRPVPATQPAETMIGSLAERDPRFAMAIRLSPLGAAVESVTLNEYYKVVNKPDPYVFQQPYSGFEAQSRTLATRWITVDGVKTDLDAVPWTLASSSPASATYTIDLHDAAGPTLRVTKTYALTEKSAEKENAAGYEVKVDFSIANLAGRAMSVTAAFNGTTTPPNENDRLPDQQTLAGYLQDPYVAIDHHLVTEYTTSAPTRDLTKNKEGHSLAWVGTGSGYFNALLRPEPATGASTTPFVARATATALVPDAKDYHHNVVLTLETQPLILPAGGVTNMPVRAFFFPKKRDLLGHAYMQATPLAFNQTLVMTSGLCGICTFQWIIDLLVGMLRAFHVVLRDWGLAIIALVCVVRAVLHPITKRSQVNMMKMGKMGPKIEQLKAKHGDDKDALNRAMMQFYKEQGATPILGCLPMFLQMPIWIALYTALQSTFELRQSPFLHFGGLKLTWIDDLAHPDRLFYFPQHAINLWFFHVDAFNVLPFLLAVVFFMQQKYTPKPIATTPEQEQQQKMMQWMTLLFPVFLYNGPAGLNLYILTSTTIGIIESKIVRKHIKEREEAEAAGVVIVDAPPTKRNDPPPTGGVRRVDPKKPAGGGGITGWFAALQQRAEDLKREADRRK